MSVKLLACLSTWFFLALPSFALEAPAIKLPMPAGGQFDLAQLRGKIVYLDFWASWCVPCKRSFPWMNQLQQRFAAQGLQVVAINVDVRVQDVEVFLKHHPARFIIALDPEAKTPAAYKIKGMPTSVLIDKSGQILWQHTGFVDADKTILEAKIEQALK